MYQTNLAGSCNVISGVQTYCIVASTFCGNDVYPAQGIQSDLLAIENVLQTQLGGNSTKRVLFKSVSGETLLQNQCNMNVQIILYDIIA